MRTNKMTDHLIRALNLILISLLLHGCNSKDNDNIEIKWVSAHPAGIIFQPYTLSWTANNALQCKLHKDNELLIKTEGNSGIYKFIPQSLETVEFSLLCSNNKTEVRKQHELSITSKVTLNNISIDLDQEINLLNSSDLEKVNLSHSALQIVNTSLNAAMTLKEPASNIKCQLGDIPLQTEDNKNFTATFQAAYFQENISLECKAQDATVLFKKIILNASDNEVQKELDIYFKYFPKYDLNNFNVEQVDLRKVNFYYEMHRIISAANIYTSPSDFNIDVGDDTYQIIENYLINVSETYFQPCNGYDFENGEPSSCRSEEKYGGYYLWRSPLNNTPTWRKTHPKVEWRSVAGISVAIKALLTRHQSDSSECWVSDIPSQVRAQSIACRAKNIRRLIYSEVYEKWNDYIYVTKTLNLDESSVIDRVKVLHYYSWIELIIDMLNSTQEIQLSGNCSIYQCDYPTLKSYQSKMLDFMTEENGHTNMLCTINNSSCVWREYDFAHSNSIDISHINILLYWMDSTNSALFCNDDNSKCISLSNLVKTLKTKAWAENSGDLAGSKNFPKFDVFLNGHCKSAIQDTSAHLNEFCLEHWAYENVKSNFHLALFGVMGYGKYDRDLMIKIRRAVDVNKDGHLDGSDILMRDNLILMTRAMSKKTNIPTH